MATAKPPILKTADLDAVKKARIYALLSDLHDAVSDASVAQTKIDAAKKALKEEFFPKLSEGTSNVILEYGKKLILTQPIYRKIDAPAYEAAIANQTITATLANAVVKHTPEVIVSGWKALTPDERKLFGDIVTESEGAIGFKIENIKS